MEFREMRRKRQQLAEEESIAILEKATAGTLALLGDNDYPYAVPISYVYHDGKLYFHSALAGHKVDAIRKAFYIAIVWYFSIFDQFNTTTEGKIPRIFRTLPLSF